MLSPILLTLWVQFCCSNIYIFQFKPCLLSALDQHELYLFKKKKKKSQSCTHIYVSYLHRPTAYWATSCKKHQTAAFLCIFTGGPGSPFKPSRQVGCFFTDIHLPLLSSFLPQHSLTALNIQPKTRRFMPRSPGSLSICPTSCRTISISGRRAGLRRSWGPLSQACRQPPPALAASVSLRVAVSTPLCPWKNRGEEDKWDRNK